MFAELDEDEMDYLETITILVEDYEKSHYPLETWCNDSSVLEPDPSGEGPATGEEDLGV